VTRADQADVRSRPLVTVVIPVHNKAPFVAATIASCFDQTYEAIEIVVIDDESTDGSTEIAASELQDRGVLVTIANGGVSNARNVGASMASVGSTYLLFLDADDVLEPDAVEQMVVALESNPGWVAVFSAPTFIDATDGVLDDERVPIRWAPTWRGRRELRDDETANPLEVLWSNFFVIPSSCLMRRDAFERTDGWDSNLCQPAHPFHSEDKDMMIQLALLGDVRRIRDGLVRYRVLPSTHRDALYDGLAALNEKWWAAPSPAHRGRARRAIRFEARVRLLDSIGELRSAVAARDGRRLRTSSATAARFAARFALVQLPLRRLPDRRRHAHR
jgi:glycosyltransferase involved in cell wall biosynthesis